MLYESEKQYLLKLARNSIESVVNNMPPPKIGPSPPALTQRCGAFVTLRAGGELRGCIGYTEGVKPLVETVQDVAVKSATEDPRFIAVSPDELSVIEIEISVISPMKLINTVEEIEIGKHGLLLEWQSYRGLLLPQVPEEYGWNRKTFLEQTARKAGLSSNAWNFPETKLYTFTAEIFDERASELAQR